MPAIFLYLLILVVIVAVGLWLIPRWQIGADGQRIANVVLIGAALVFLFMVLFGYAPGVSGPVWR